MKHLNLFAAIVFGGLFGAHAAEGQEGPTVVFLALVALNVFLYAINDK